MVWDKPEELNQLCREVLLKNGTSEEELGLSVYIRLRAPQWLGTCGDIASPVMALGDALRLQSRLLRAKHTSWKALRAEWVALMRSERRVRIKMRSLEEAQAIADTARQKYVLQLKEKEEKRQLRLQASAARREQRLQQEQQERERKRKAREQKHRECKRKREQEWLERKSRRRAQEEANLEQRLIK